MKIIKDHDIIKIFNIMFKIFKSSNEIELYSYLL